MSFATAIGSGARAGIPAPSAARSSTAEASSIAGKRSTTARASSVLSRIASRITLTISSWATGRLDHRRDLERLGHLDVRDRHALDRPLIVANGLEPVAPRRIDRAPQIIQARVGLDHQRQPVAPVDQLGRATRLHPRTRQPVTFSGTSNGSPFPL